MRLPISVTGEDGKARTVHTSPWSVMVWERKYKTKLSAAIEAGLGMEDLAYLAYTSAKLAGWDLPENFEEWVRTLQDVSGGEDEAAPFDEGASAG